MTDNNEHKPSDDELNDFLGGRHAVSAAYQDLEKVSSPKELDERILARSREDLARHPAATSIWSYRSYAAAATIFLCLSLTFMFVNDPNIPSPADLQSPAEVRRVLIPVTQEQEAGSPVPAESTAGLEFAEADANDALEPLRANENSNQQAPAQARNLGELIDLVEEARLSEQEGVAIVNRAESTATANAATIAPTALESADAVLAEDVAIGNTQQSSEFADEDALEEIVVTGARIADLNSYRNDQQSWLEEIARLRAEDETESALEEEALFRGNYPDTDLEAALAALENE